MPLRPFLTGAIALLAGATLLGCDSERATSPGESLTPALSNGLLNNGHDRLYKFNVIGVPREKNPDMTGDNGRRMFVKLEG